MFWDERETEGQQAPARLNGNAGRERGALAGYRLAALLNAMFK